MQAENPMSAVTERSAGNIVHLDDWRENRAEAIRVLQASLYPGAKPESCEMVLAYCGAAKLDPFQKPVHIVPMSVNTGPDQNGDDIYETRDVVMPGIGLYRVQAARTGEYAGMDEPVFGPSKTLTYKKRTTEWFDKPNGGRGKRDKWVDATLEYPECCKVVVYRLVGGVRCPFPAVEFWTENYATAGKWTDAPNTMWAKRPRGQLVKCAEAQALRKAFPEVGAQPTAEEMEGRHVDAEDIRSFESAGGSEPDDLMPRAKSANANADDAQVVGHDRAIDAPAATDTPAETPKQDAPEHDSSYETVTTNMVTVLRKKAAANNVADADICEHFRVATLDKLPRTKINEAMKLAGGAK